MTVLKCGSTVVQGTDRVRVGVRNLGEKTTISQVLGGNTMTLYHWFLVISIIATCIIDYISILTLRMDGKRYEVRRTILQPHHPTLEEHWSDK